MAFQRWNNFICSTGEFVSFESLYFITMVSMTFFHQVNRECCQTPERGQPTDLVWFRLIKRRRGSREWPSRRGRRQTLRLSRCPLPHASEICQHFGKPSPQNPASPVTAPLPLPSPGNGHTPKWRRNTNQSAQILQNSCKSS